MSSDNASSMTASNNQNLSKNSSVKTSAGKAKVATQSAKKVVEEEYC